MIDPDFGELRYERDSRYPEGRSWTAQWMHPEFDHRVGIWLPGSNDGPAPTAREFALRYRTRSAVEALVAVARPLISRQFEDWTKQPLAPNLWEDLELLGIDILDAEHELVRWEVAFDIRRESMIMIGLEMLGETPQRTYIDD